MRALREALAERPRTRRVRTVYLGTSDFAVGRARAPRRAARTGRRSSSPAPTGRRAAAASSSPPPVAEAAARLGHRDRPARPASTRTRPSRASPRPSPTALIVCAYGALIKEPLLSACADPQRPPVAAAALARRGADRARDHGRRRRDRRVDHGLVAELDAGPVLPAGARADRAPTTPTARSRRGWPALSGELLVRALDERPPARPQHEDGVDLRREDRARGPALRRRARLGRRAGPPRPRALARTSAPGVETGRRRAPRRARRRATPGGRPGPGGARAATASACCSGAPRARSSCSRSSRPGSAA